LSGRTHVLALDLGTTSVRALVVGEDGSVRGRASRPLETRYPGPGRVEQDPAGWWRGAQQVMAESLARAGLRAADLGALGVVTQRATALAWDARTGAPLAPALGWQDVRAAPRVAELAKQGIPLSPLASAAKFEWLLEHVPELRAAARAGRLRLGTPDAWLGDRLSAGASFATDPGQASCTGLYDLRGASWLAAPLAALGIEPGWLPRVEATSETLAETPGALLGAPVPVSARAGDQQAAAFAQGVYEPGAGKLTLGTAAMLDVHSGDAPAPFARGAFPLALWRLSGGGQAFCLEGSVVTAGSAIEWLVELGLLGAPDALDAVAGSTATTDGVVFVPALQGLGTPFLDERARGAWLGLTRGSCAPHLVRAALEGIAQRCADLCEALPLRPGPLPVDGGLARSDLLLARLADLSGRELDRAAETETTALGAAYLAGLAVGVWPDPASARATAAPPARFAPRIGDGERAPQRASWQRAPERVRAG
jgi:glycerol kinase